MLFVHADELIVDEFTFVKDEQCAFGQRGEQIGGIFKEGQDEVVCAARFQIRDDLLHPGVRRRGGRLLALCVQRLHDAHPLLLRGGCVRRRDEVDAVQFFIALPRHLVIGLDALHLVAEEIDADGVLQVDGIDVQHVAADGKGAALLGTVLARIARAHEPVDEPAHVVLCARLQVKTGKFFGHELRRRLDIGDEHLRPRLPLIQRRQAAIERVAAARLAVGEHLVLCREQGDLLSGERADILRRALRGECVRRQIDDAPLHKRGDQMFLRVRNAEHRRGNAVFYRRAQQRIVAVQDVKGEKALHVIRYTCPSRGRCAPRPRARRQPPLRACKPTKTVRSPPFSPRRAHS